MAAVNSNEPCMEIEQQEIRQFENRDKLLKYLRDTAYTQGYALSIIDTRPISVTLSCDRGGKYRDRRKQGVGEKKKRTSSRLINCPFRIKGTQAEDDFWTFEIKNGEHNHEMSTEISGHPSARRLSREELLRIKEMSAAGIQPRKMLTTLRQSNTDINAISRDIYNAKSKVRREILGGRTEIEALFDEFVDGGFTYDVKCDGDGKLTHIFFAHPLSVDVTRSYSVTFIMDCTYKTNKYNMPLLDIIGVTSFNTAYYSCFVFLRREETADYVWALGKFKDLLDENLHPMVIVTDRELALMNAIQIVFPTTANILCRWHINKNILKNCKGYFSDKDGWNNFYAQWNSLIDNDTSREFDEAWNRLTVDYGDQVLLLKYISSTWIPHKEKFVKAWAKNYLHFGNIVTSKAEGAHSILKKYLEVSTGCLHEVKKKLCFAIENQFQDVKTRLSSEKVRIPHIYNIPFFKNIIGHVSHFALKKLFEQFEFATKESYMPYCSHHFTPSMGLPCAHKMKSMLDRNEVLCLNDIHGQWKIDDHVFKSVEMDGNPRLVQMKDMLDYFFSAYKQWPSSYQEYAFAQFENFVKDVNLKISEPEAEASKGRPKGSKSTQRDPSGFEYMEKKKCSICQGNDHNCRTCPKRPEPYFSTNVVKHVKHIE